MFSRGGFSPRYGSGEPIRFSSSLSATVGEIDVARRAFLPRAINATPFQNESLLFLPAEDHEVRRLAGRNVMLGAAEEPGGVTANRGQDLP